MEKEVLLHLYLSFNLTILLKWDTVPCQFMSYKLRKLCYCMSETGILTEKTELSSSMSKSITGIFLSKVTSPNVLPCITNSETWDVILEY